MLTIIDRLQCLQQQNINFTSTHCELVYKHALNYSLNALVNRTKKETTVAFPIKHFMNDNDMDADTWKQHRLQQLFPHIFAKKPATATVPAPAVLPSITQATKDPKEDETNRLLKAYLANQLQQQQAKKEDTEKCLGMCESEYNLLLTYAGVTNNDEMELPQLWHKLAEKNISKVGKANAARSALRNTTVKYRECKIKVTPSLLTMITTRHSKGTCHRQSKKQQKACLLLHCHQSQIMIWMN